MNQRYSTIKYKMHRSKEIHLIATPHDEMWYFNVSSPPYSLGTSVCECHLGFPVIVKGIAVPESVPFGSLSKAVDIFQHSLKDKVHEASTKEISKVEKRVKSLVRIIESFKSMGKAGVEDLHVLQDLRSEEHKKLSALESSRDSESHIVRVGTKREGRNGTVSTWVWTACEYGEETDSESDEEYEKRENPFRWRIPKPLVSPAISRRPISPITEIAGLDEALRAPRINDEGADSD